MKKAFGLVVFVVLAVLVMAVPANAQAICWGCIPGDMLEEYYYVSRGDNVGLVTSRNLRFVRDTMGQRPRSLRDNLYWNGQYGAYGLSMGRGGFYPMYDRNMRPMGRREATATYGAIGAGLGYGISGNTQGTAIGAGVGALVGLITHRGNNQRDNGVIVTPPQDQQGQQGRYIGPGGIPVAVGVRLPYAPVQPVIEKRSGEFTLSNSTRFKVDVYDGVTSIEANFKFRLAPGEKRGVDAPEDRYRGLALVPNIHGNISTEEFGVSPTDAGWIFIEPDVMKGR